MFERFTSRARTVADLAQEIARNLKHPNIGTEHILLAFITEGGGITAQALHNLDVMPSKVIESLNKLAPAPSKKAISGSIPFDSDARKAFSLALKEAQVFGHNYIGTEHILLGILGIEKCLAMKILVSMNIDPNLVRTEVTRLMGEWDEFGDSQPSSEPNLDSIIHPKEPISNSNPPQRPLESAGGGFSRRDKASLKSPALDTFAHNLTQDALEGRLDPVIGRDNETERLLQVLGRRTKNNPVLIGEPGVGKSAVIEGLAQRIVNGDVPSYLIDTQIYSLDLAKMLAGTRYRGDFEERLKKTIKEVQDRKNVILFLDEVHVLAGAGGAEGSVDASNMLKPMLARGELRLIGATTLDEYRKYIEKDAALERRFQPIKVEAASVKDTIAILTGLRDRYSKHHKVTFTDDALIAAATLADRYITDRNLPDKAIDVLDEAGARLQMQKLIRSPEVITIEREIANTQKAKSEAIDTQDFDLAASLRSQELLLNDKKSLLESDSKKKSGTPLVVTADSIAEIITLMTGVPIMKMTEKDTSNLLNIETELHHRVIGQVQAISALSRAIRRTRAGLKDPKRPAGSFIFAGPSGVGKSELAKALAEFLNGDDDSLITIDMSEYSEKHTASRLFGAPPGYVGHDEGGQLTEKIRRKPFSVVLFDEMEKAHPDIANTLLQVLDEGRLTDSQGRVVDFKNTVIVMTTNLGSRDVAKNNYVGFSTGESINDYERMKSKVQEELKQFFRPEFLNRVDEIVVFQTLKLEEIIEIVDLMLERLNKRLNDKSMEIRVTKEAKERLANMGYDKAMGARPLRRVIQREIEDQLSERILFGSILPGQVMLVDVNTEEGLTSFTFTPKGIDLVEDAVYDIVGQA